MTSGPGAYCARTPEAAGPAAVPTANARVARIGPAKRPDGYWYRVMTAWAAPVTAPSASAWQTRPAKSHAGPSATRKQQEPAAPSSTLSRSIGRLPTRSAAGPNSSSAGQLTRANVANSRVMTRSS